MRPGLLLLIAMLPAQGLAQRRVPGYLVTSAGDSLLGVLYLSDEVTRQTSLRFARPAVSRTQTWRPYQVRAYGYVARGQAVRYVRFRLPGAQTAYVTGWLRQVQQGHVDLFELRRLGFRQEFWIRRGKQPLENTTYWNLPVQGPAYFADNAPVAAALRSGRCSTNDLPRLVALYNRGVAPESK
jgi:hypothetical protein